VRPVIIGQNNHSQADPINNAGQYLANPDWRFVNCEYMELAMIVFELALSIVNSESHAASQ
jgi:hypothetical protein